MVLNNTVKYFQSAGQVGTNQRRQNKTFYRPGISKINTVQKVSLDYLEPNK